MSTNKHIEKICCIAVIFALLITCLFMNGEALGLRVASKSLGYESRLFTTDRVHTIDIVMDDWSSFIESCENEEYVMCTAVIDGEAFHNIGIRAKGNTSLSNVSLLNSERYSFKLEFDQYDSTKNYYGLDKLNLNNLIQDNTMMKDFLVYQLMNAFGVNAPLCSFVYITVNNQDWGLYLAVEGVEDGFLQRNYGNDSGELYKPDSLSFGMGSNDVKLQYIDDDLDSYSNIFDNAKTDIKDSDKLRLIASLKTLSTGENIENAVNVEEVIRYFVVHNFVVNGDSYTGSMIHNYYLYEKDGLLSMIPWDYNLAFGTFSVTTATDAVNDPIDTPVSGGNMDELPMIAWIFSDEDYTQLYHDYFADFLSTCFTSGYFTELIDATYKQIAPYVEKDPTKFCTYDEFVKGADTIKEFCLLRAESVQGQLNGTVASTTQAQKTNGNSLIDASSIALSDMGDMGNTAGGGEHMEPMQPPFDKEHMEPIEPPSDREPMQPMQPPSDREHMEPMQFPSDMGELDSMQPSSLDSATLILFIASVLTLLISIFGVYKFKK